MVGICNDLMPYMDPYTRCAYKMHNKLILSVTFSFSLRTLYILYIFRCDFGGCVVIKAVGVVSAQCNYDSHPHPHPAHSSQSNKTRHLHQCQSLWSVYIFMSAVAYISVYGYRKLVMCLSNWIMTFQCNYSFFNVDRLRDECGGKSAHFVFGGK